MNNLKDTIQALESIDASIKVGNRTLACIELQLLIKELLKQNEEQSGV